MSRILYISNIAGKKMSYGFVGTAIEAAKSMGIEFYCVSNRSKATPEDIREDEEKYGVKLLHFDLARSPFSLQNIKAYKQLCNIIREYKIDYIHCNTPVGGLLGRLAGKKCKVKKVIYQAHGFHFYKGAPLRNWLLYYPVEKWLAHYTDLLITINQEDYALAKKKIKAKKVAYVPGVGVDLTKYINVEVDKATKLLEIGVPENAIVLLSVGELNENKNHQVIIRAIAKLNVKTLHYVIAGQGSQQSCLEKLATSLGVKDQVHFLGFRKDVPQLCAVADIFCFPSCREGLGVASLEAMASGLPLLTSDVHGINDYSKEGLSGYKFSPLDVNGFATGIKRLMDNPDVGKRMGIHNREEVKRYGFDIALCQLQALYQEVLGGNSTKQ